MDWRLNMKLYCTNSHDLYSKVAVNVNGEEQKDSGYILCLPVISTLPFTSRDQAMNWSIVVIHNLFLALHSMESTVLLCLILLSEWELRREIEKRKEILMQIWMFWREDIWFLRKSFKGKGHTFCKICHINIPIDHGGPTTSITIKRLGKLALLFCYFIS